ncbi:MAG: sodium ion-translocating decarboxylase subunit beta [Exilispira sp.]|jgi:oxaloacetate decarboxylase beta subunit|nr:sodium ion-translocating decarboxylase subunit beta [Exilispira sp.]
MKKNIKIFNLFSIHNDNKPIGYKNKKNFKLLLYCFLFVATLGFIFNANAQSSQNNINLSNSYNNDKMEINSKNFMSSFNRLFSVTGIYSFIFEKKQITEQIDDNNFEIYNVTGWQKFIMIIIGLVLIYLGAVKNFEPLLLLPIAFGTILVNTPIAGIGEPPHGFLYIIFNTGIKNELFPLIIFMGIGALTDFGPLIANPKLALLGAAAQFGIFGSLLGAISLNLIPGISFSLKDACAISIIGGADGPTSIYVASKLAPNLLGSIAVAAYSYMALVPLIQPPIMRLLTTKSERLIKMENIREVSKVEKIIFPLLILLLCILFIPSATPLLGALTFGNFLKEVGIVERLSRTMQNELLNIVTIFLGLGVGMQMSAHKFLQGRSLGILAIGLIAFILGTAGGVLFAKFINIFSKKKINPLIGSAGVSAVPMAARVSNKLGLEEDPSNFLLMHAMGPNVAGVIGSAIAAGVMIALFG